LLLICSVLLADTDEKVKYSSTLNFAAPDVRQSNWSKYSEMGNVLLLFRERVGMAWYTLCKHSLQESVWEHSGRTTLLTTYLMSFPLPVYITIPVKTGRMFWYSLQENSSRIFLFPQRLL